MNITENAVIFVTSVAETVLEAKPEATSHEIIGVVYQILNNTIEKLKNEQLPESRPVEGGAGTKTEPGQIQGAGIARGLEESTQGIRSEQKGLTRSGAKKRRGSKKA